MTPVANPDLSVSFAGITLKNPIIAASGTFGYGIEFEDIVHLDRLGGLVVKGLSKEPMTGNPPPRLYETAAGMLNAIGLQNIGAQAFLAEKLPALREKKNVVVFANVYGFTRADYEQTIEILNQGEGIAAYEINVSCPNTAHGGIQFGSDPLLLDEVVRTAKRVAARPIIVKLSPNVTSIAQMAYVAQEAGADALSLVNTFVAMAIDPETRRPRIANVTAGLSGPAIKPIALRMVYDAARAVKDSGDRDGRNHDSNRCGGIYAGRSNGRAGGDGKFLRSGGDGNAGRGTHRLLPRTPHRAAPRAHRGITDRLRIVPHTGPVDSEVVSVMAMLRQYASNDSLIRVEVETLSNL
jgi:dihydroorotate dehydrogenase (NAD+) catalytic subunit